MCYLLALALLVNRRCVSEALRLTERERVPDNFLHLQYPTGGRWRAKRTLARLPMMIYRSLVGVRVRPVDHHWWKGSVVEGHLEEELALTFNHPRLSAASFPMALL